MKIKLLEGVRQGMAGDYKLIPQRYWKGDLIEVVPADNLPEDSKIKYWVKQDGWDEDGEGFPIYEGTYVEILYVPEHLEKWKMPKSDYGGEDMSEFYIVISRTRDSDHLEESNWARILEDYPEDYDEETNKGVLVANFGHWACGWFELLLVHETDFELLETMDEIKRGLSGYPVYDDDDLSNRESEDQWELCKDEIEYYIRNSDEDLDLSDDQISEMIYWFVNESNGFQDYPDDDEIEDLIERILHWKTCNVCVEYNNTHSNGEGYRKESYDERFDCCGCQMKLEM